MDRLRIATFNLDSLDQGPGVEPPIEQRATELRPLLVGLDADILCLQEINAQPKEGPRRLDALARLLADTPYAAYRCVHTIGPGGGGPADIHNLATLSRVPIRAWRQIRHEFVHPPTYRLSTAIPPAPTPAAVTWDRPILMTTHEIGGGRAIHVINLHLRAPLAAYVPGQKLDALSWKSAAGWAEGFFLAAIKRAGQATEARLLVDSLFDADAGALIAVCGDFNAELNETPLRVVCADPEDTGNAGLASRSMHPAEAEVPVASRYTLLHDGRRALLDHVLVSGALRAHLARTTIHNRELIDEVKTAGQPISGSAHAPVVAEFALP